MCMCVCVSYTCIARLQITGVIQSEGDADRLYFIYWTDDIEIEIVVVVSIFVALIH
jgi:hypothetical protein